MSTQVLSTPLYQAHLDSGAKVVDFSGYLLPINYGSQIKEHEAVRQDAGMFDVSHMVITDISGANSKQWLSQLISNDVNKLTTQGKALYTAMLTEEGHVIDDLLLYLTDFGYRIVSNAARRERDLAWFNQTAKPFGVTLQVRDDLAMLAVQGPNAITKLLLARPAWKKDVLELGTFYGKQVDSDGTFVVRTGYTGEEGVEVMIPAEKVTTLFNDLKAQGVMPCGLGARDTLRLEAGMNLYGHDIDETVTPYEVGMGWTVAMSDDRDFIGKQALLEQKSAGVPNKQLGLIIEGRAILRDGTTVHIPGHENGIITSGSFSPTLNHPIAIVRVPFDVALTDSVEVEIRGKPVAARFVKLPFVRHGEKQFQ